MLTKTPGLVLHVLPLEHMHSVITLFSPLGILKCFAKQGQALHCEFREALIPFSLGHYTLDYRPPKIRRLLHAELCQTFAEVQASYVHIHAAGMMVRGILTSQLPEKPSQPLFSLLLNFLHYLPKSKNPDMFAATFLLKLLQYEGILDLSSICSQCKHSLEDSTCYRYQGLKFCSQHRPAPAIPIEIEEEKILHALVQARQFQEILHLSDFPLDFSQRILKIFESTLEQNALT